MAWVPLLYPPEDIHLFEGAMAIGTKYSTRQEAEFEALRYLAMAVEDGEPLAAYVAQTDGSHQITTWEEVEMNEKTQAIAAIDKLLKAKRKTREMYWDALCWAGGAVDELARDEAEKYDDLVDQYDRAIEARTSDRAMLKLLRYTRKMLAVHDDMDRTANPQKLPDEVRIWSEKKGMDRSALIAAPKDPEFISWAKSHHGQWIGKQQAWKFRDNKSGDRLRELKMAALRIYGTDDEPKPEPTEPKPEPTAQVKPGGPLEQIVKDPDAAWARLALKTCKPPGGPEGAIRGICLWADVDRTKALTAVKDGTKPPPKIIKTEAEKKADEQAKIYRQLKSIEPYLEKMSASSQKTVKDMIRKQVREQIPCIPGADELTASERSSIAKATKKAPAKKAPEKKAPEKKARVVVITKTVAREYCDANIVDDGDLREFAELVQQQTSANVTITIGSRRRNLGLIETPDLQAAGIKYDEKKAPEKKAPEKKAPEKKAPEKKAPEKKAPEKKATALSTAEKDAAIMADLKSQIMDLKAELMG